MTKKNYTAIVLVVDKSGSMTSIADETQQALEEFVKEQKKLDGGLTLDLVYFNHEYETRESMLDLRKTRKKIDFDLNPSGMTALFDAVGRKIDSFGEVLEKLPEDERPEKVLFVIATDGAENSSQEYTREMIADRIKTQKEDFNWEFVFLGANQDAILTAQILNIPASSAITFNASGAGVMNVVDSLSSYTVAYRSSKKAEFSDKDRSQAMQ